jgi:ribonuclease HI
MQALLYSDGCYSHKYKTGGTGSTLIMGGKKKRWGMLVAGLDAKGAEIEFIAQLEAILWFYRKAKGQVSEIDLVMFTDNDEVRRKFRGFMQKKSQAKLPVSLRDKYNYVFDILKEFKSWEIREEHAKGSKPMSLADKISREHMHALRSIVIKKEPAYV